MPAAGRAAGSSVAERGGLCPRRLPLGLKGLPAQLPWGVSSPGEPGLREGAELFSKCERTHLHAALSVSWLPCLCACRAALLPVLLVHAAISPLFYTKAAPVLMQGEEKVRGKCWAPRAVLAAQTCVPCFLQVSRESGSATAMSLAESSTCTAFKWFAYHQWYTTVWEPLV